MFKMEIEFDRTILEKDGYDYEHTMNLLCDNFRRAGFIEELKEDSHLMYKGTDAPNDLSYFGLIYEALLEQQWFKNCVTKWLLFSNDCIGSAEFKCVGNFIESAQNGGLW